MTPGADYYSIRFDADPVQLVFFRYGLDRWLQSIGWPEKERVDVILAVSEACSNAVQHAYPVGYPGEVEVIGRLVIGPDQRHLSVVVRDWGQWRGDGAGGYGLTTVRACMARMKIKHDAGGTAVTMTSRPVPAVVADAPRGGASAGPDLLAEG